MPPLKKKSARHAINQCPSINGIFWPNTAFSAGFHPRRTAAATAVKTLVRPCLGPKSTLSGRILAPDTPPESRSSWMGSS